MVKVLSVVALLTAGFLGTQALPIAPVDAVKAPCTAAEAQAQPRLGYQLKQRPAPQTKPKTKKKKVQGKRPVRGKAKAKGREPASVAAHGNNATGPTEPEPAHHTKTKGKEATKGGAGRPDNKAQFGWWSDYTVRGVNLGSWFVLESWMVPSIFDAPDLKGKGVIDEWTYSKALGKSNASYARMEEHYASWITEDDFAQMASYGLNTVRLPVGYWAFIDEADNDQPYFAGIQQPYIGNALRWASTYGMDVVFDLHGVPGSQNGFDNSGKAGPILFPDSQKNADVAIGALVKAVELYVNDPSYDGVIKAIEVVNEPRLGSDFPRSFLNKFYKDSYDAIMKAIDVDNAVTVPTVMFHDGFLGLSQWDTFFDEDDGFEDGSYVLDVHKYQAFEPELNLNEQQHIELACNFTTELRAASDIHPVVVGEFFLNINTNVPANKPDNRTMQDDIDYYNTDEQNLFYRRYWEAQTSVFEDQSTGWIYWAWKTENAAMGSYQAGVQQGWIPEDPDERVFPPMPYDTTCVSKEPIWPLTFATRTASNAKARPMGSRRAISSRHSKAQP